MKTAYFDCHCGISGDMVLGALLDAGLNYKTWQKEVEGLGLKGFSVSRRRVKRAGIPCTKLTIKVNTKQPHRNLADIEKLILKSGISKPAKQMALCIFRRLGAAESKAHGEPVDKVHFHEVGAVDAIIDIAGAAIALDMLGIEKIVSSPLNLGSGTVTFSHGTFPVPAPATAVLVKDFPVYSSGVMHELTTPTGAAIITSLADGFGPMPGMTSRAVGCGAGDKEIPETPNMLRVFLGESGEGYAEDFVELIETNIDDMDPRLFEHVMDRLFDNGALDVWLTQVIMKKSRPGVKLSVLSEQTGTSALVDIVMSETTTFGVRISRLERRKLERELLEIKTPHGRLQVKVGRIGKRVLKAMPEYEDVKKLAGRTKKPARDIIAETYRLLKDKQ